ncbi:MAG: ATP phosphoribosyltransferase regulatory subunit [Roseburia sp.]|nr:ATP phosphoribosyltransferase regulatory subunit [Roseburia sp.]
MRRQLLHTPEGVRDIYNDECAKKLILQDSLYQMLVRYGYHPIQTPTFEFFDIFGREIGTTPSRDLYKFFDREGNTLVLRPDITPSIARCAAKYFGEEDMPIRLCYMGNTFINNSSYQGRLKESTQLGAELLGDSSVDADAEMLSMVVSCLKTAGLKEFQISVGHADFFRGLMDAAGLLGEQEDELRELISNKNFFGVEEFVETLNLNSDLRKLFGMLGNLYTGTDELLEAKAYAKEYPRIEKAIDDLEELHRILEVYDISRYVSFELGIISNYQYYTGIIFAGYTFGSGEAIVKGGRYDKLLTYFGKDSASIGFAIVIDQLMAALSRQKIEIPFEKQTLLIVYESQGRTEAIRHAKELRENGRAVELILRDAKKSKDDYLAYAARNNITEVRFI